MVESNTLEKRYSKLQMKIALVEGRKCDEYDYLIAVFSGLVSGLIDSFFVGKPNFENNYNSKLGTLSDDFSNKVLEKVSDQLISRDLKIYSSLKASGLKGEELHNALEAKGIPKNYSLKGYPTIKDKITYLENKFKVSYDQSTNDKLMGDYTNITPGNHHLKSLSHTPDFIGLIFAVLDQFTKETTVVEKGKLIRVVPVENKIELRGSDVISKLFCAVCNWLGHLLSDFCGSHSSKGRGAGIPIPFFELFQFCDFGSFTSVSNSKKQTEYSIATLAVKVYENGYDARHGIAMSTPLIINDLIIKFLWAIKKHFVHNFDWRECIPSEKYPDLRLMMIIGNGCLCVTDGVDAAIRSKGDILEFALHLNYVAWLRLATRVLKELELRFGFTYEDLKTQYEYLNYKLDQYLLKLESIDYNILNQEINDLQYVIDEMEGSELLECDKVLYIYIKKYNIKLDFSSFNEFEDLMIDDDYNFVL